jgi:hypothetical protein
VARFAGVALAEDFANHDGAWVAGGTGSLQFFAHSVNWGQIRPGHAVCVARKRSGFRFSRLNYGLRAHTLSPGRQRELTGR